MEADAELNRLRWRCTRRAMLEMDLLLGDFLDTHFSGLTPEQAAAFVVLADMEDLELWPLITGKRECANSLQAEVVSMLRDVRVKYSSGNAPTSGQA
ncbi:MAG: succinate dehydrogenase assembly factor 2 [Propionivibrio sp.]|nr:succinate dehydrogenase assembly factor 2 [Propionivibrio sp.]MBL0208156.1 succinate dehydrogenase assembly factor 2 [Propionivibrio sp.]